MTREEKVIMYVMGLLEESIRAGTLRGGRFRLADEGLQCFHELKEQKFKPTKDELETAFVLLSSPPEEIKEAYRLHGKIEFSFSFAWFKLMTIRLLKGIH